MHTFILTSALAWGFQPLHALPRTPRPHIAVAARPQPRIQPEFRVSKKVLQTRGGQIDSLLSLKLGLAASLCGLNVACWAIPLRFKSFRNSERALSLASTFSGGVFLSLAFAHLVPEAAEAFGATLDVGTAMQLSCVWTLFGYLIIWGVEHLSIYFRGGHSHTGGSHQQQQQPKNNGGAALLLAALSIHSILETMALAVARTKFAAVLLAASIALHQPAESIALLVTLLRAGLTGKKLRRLLITFSIMGPIGSALGLFLHDFISNPILDAILIALTAGTFVYVGATEVIPEEFDSETPKEDLPKKAAFLLSGVASMLALVHFTARLEKSVLL